MTQARSPSPDPPGPPAPDRCEGDSLYDDPWFYGRLFDDRRHDLPFYLELARHALGPVLELGVGTGRVALPLARAGHAVVGIDPSAAMIALFRARLAAEDTEVRGRVELRVADARGLALGRRFGLITMPFNAMAHLHDARDLDALFTAVRSHLEPDGRFAFDVLVADPVRLAGASSTVPWFRHPRTGEVCRADEEVRYDPATRLVTIETTIRFMEVERPDEHLALRIRQFEPYEMERIVRRRGFEIESRDGSLVDATGYVCRLGAAVPAAAR